MKILFLCHRYPFPPNRGGKIRPFHILKHLSRTHDVTVAAVIRSEDGIHGDTDLRAYCTKTLTTPTSELASYGRAIARVSTRQPSSMGYFYSPQLAAAVRTELLSERYEMICVHCSSVAPYVASAGPIPKLLDFGDMDSQKWLAYARHRRFPLALVYGLEGCKMQRAESALARQFDLCSCTTRDELDTLRSYAAPRRSGWFPNGVDTEYFVPTAEPYDADTLCFLGRMDYYPNRECMMKFCAETFPRLRQRRPRIKLLIVGAAPSHAVRRLAREPGVVVTGSVADVRPHVRRAALSVAPLRIARGTQNKILESMAMGIPVVCSPIAARGVDAIPGEHLLTAADASESVEAILHLLENPTERRRLAAAGRARMLSHHTWDHSMRQLDRLVDECVAARSVPQRT